MHEPDIDEALTQVRLLKERVLDKRFFRGYSGWARIATGLLALAASGALGSDSVPATPSAHLMGWGLLLVAALLLNYGALAWWFVAHREVRQNPVMLKPALDAIPALAVGAVLTMALIAAREYNLLFGVWMCAYGIAQTAYRQSLPRGIYFVGLVYLVCGACLLLRPAPFTSPWPMGVVFGFGEWAGGLFLLQNKEDLR